MIDIFHSEELVSMFCEMPGILSLLPLNKDEGNDFADLATWQNAGCI
jgi:hypothetical protein